MAASPLTDFTYYANRSLGGVDDPNSDRAQAALTSVRQYDPTARYRPTYGSDGQLLGYTLDYDASKLPGMTGQGNLGGTSGHGSGADYQPFFSTVQPNMHLANPSLVTDSPAYGRVTPNTNIEQQNDIWSILGPLAVLGFGAAAPALFGAYSTLGAGAGAAGAGSAAAGASGSGGLLDGSLMPMIPTDEASLYTPMLPFNAADPSLAINGITPAEAAAGGGAALGGGGGLDPGTLQTMMPQDPASLYNPMLPFNPQDPTLALQPGLLSRLGSAVSSALKNPGIAQALGGGAGGAGAGMGGGGGGGLLGGGRGATTDPLALLKAFYGDPIATGLQYLAQQRHGMTNG